MSRYIISVLIESENDAFQDNPYFEAARIFNEQILPRICGGHEGQADLKDTNGNTVGTMWQAVEPDEEDEQL